MGRDEMDDDASGALIDASATTRRSARSAPSCMQFHQRMLMLQIVDAQWKDHLYSLDHLKEGIGLRGYGQRDPLVEYKKESFAMFQALMDRIDEEILRWIFLYQPVPSRTRVPTRAATPATPRRSRPRAPRSGGGRRRSRAEPATPRAAAGLGLGGARPLPRNLTFNDPTEAPSAFAEGASRRKRRAAATTCRRSSARARRSAATIPVPAAAARSTRSATVRTDRRGGAGCLKTSCPRR